MEFQTLGGVLISSFQRENVAAKMGMESTKGIQLPSISIIFGIEKCLNLNDQSFFCKQLKCWIINRFELLQRSTRRIDITPEGVLYFEHAKRIVDAYQQAEVVPCKKSLILAEFLPICWHTSSF